MGSGPHNHRIAALVLATLMLVLVLVSATAAAGRPYKIIIHPSNPEITVERELLREVFLKKATEWHGRPIRPIDLASTTPTRDRFTREILKKTPAQLRSYWNQQIFSGKGVPPPEAATSADVIAYVLANPGAVGYLPAEVDPGAAKVVEIR